MTNVRSPESQAVLRAGYSASVLGVLMRQPQRVAGLGQCDPTQKLIFHPSRLQQSFSYDGLGRLVGATATQLLTDTGEPEALAQSRFVYDGAGKRLLAETASSDVVSTLTQEFGPGNKLLSSQTSKLDTASDETSYEQRNYSYDPAGRRAGVSGAENATYGYDWRNQPTRTTDDVSSTRVTYDGLGRPVSRETETAYSSEAVTSSFFGGAQLGSVSTLYGASSNVWGVFGQLAGIDSAVTGEARWALLDRLGSVVAEAGGVAGVMGADIRELASYAEFGVPSYETDGFTSPYGYTGELQDAGTGVVAFGSRSYDAGSGTWMAPDAWPGLIVGPQSLNRYAYVLGDPVTLIDVGGFAATVPNASGAANHYNYSGGAWKPILTPKPSVPNASGVANHYDWNGSGWRAVLTPELESMRGWESARHDAATRQCSALISSPMCVSTFGILDQNRSSSEIAMMLLMWRLGTDPRTVNFGPNSALTQAIMGHSTTSEYRQRVLNALRAGTSLDQIKPGGYTAGDLSISNPNLWRDALTILSFPVQNDTNRMLVALGTYDLKATVVSMSPGSNSAVVRFTATNESTAGSFLRTGSQEFYDQLNRLTGEKGQMSALVENFMWEETISW